MLTEHNLVEEPLWIKPKSDSAWKEKIVKEFKIHPITAQILISRDFTSVDEINHYLYSKLPDLHDPNLLAEMPKALERILQALEKKEHILIYGDNDVDGMTGTALLTEFFQFIGGNVHFFVSTPGTLRHNLIIEALDFAFENNCKLIITVDCGITAANEIVKVKEKGIDVIITDHHEPTDAIPHCAATLNPKLLNNQYPNRDLTGVGVAFKLTHAIANRFVEDGKLAQDQVDLKRYLDLVALGTISDMGPLRGENRILVRYGLDQIKKGKRIGLAKLVSVSEMKLNEISSFTIASKIAPRLNSLGRIADPQKGVEMLLVRNNDAAEQLAIELDLNNIERQKIERTMSTDVESSIEKYPNILNNKAIIMHSNKWHPGVIAIISTRISKQYNRPTVMIAVENGVGKGSLRSIHEFPLLGALKQLSDILINFGGHDFAAGLTLKEENIPEFKKRFIEIANETLKDSDVINKLPLDSDVKFEDLTFELMESIKLLEPYGNENPQPVLYCEAIQSRPPKVIGKTHLKLYLQQGDRMLEGVAFGKADQFPLLKANEKSKLQIAFTPQVNDYLGQSIQLMIKDFKFIQ